MESANDFQGTRYNNYCHEFNITLNNPPQIAETTDLDGSEYEESNSGSAAAHGEGEVMSGLLPGGEPYQDVGEERDQPEHAERQEGYHSWREGHC